MTSRPNILLIVFDTARADVFEPYGAIAGSTPTIAQLAAAGMAHPLAYANSSWTVPSHMSLFSGLLPRSAGIHLGAQNRDTFRQVLHHHRDRLLASVMSKAGYHTVAISANGWITEESGFAAGFDEFRSVMSSRHKTLGSSSWRDRARWVIEGSRAALDDGAAEIAQVIAARLSERKPIFCFVNLVECHSPYLPPKPHNSLGWAERLRATRDANRYCTFEAFWLQAFGRTEVPESSTQRMRTLYGDSIRQLDSWTEQVLSMLDGARLLGDTQVIVTSDHGENFGEGGLTGHTFSLDDRLIRIPFVTAGPLDLAAGPVLTLADVPRLLADAAGIPEHPWLEAPADSGVAVAQFPAPARRGDPDVERRVNELQLDQAALDKVCRGFDCATDGNLKILRDDEGDELVDLINDPLEVKPIRLDLAAATAHGEQVARLRRALDRAAAESLDGLIEAPESVVPSSENEKAALERQMRLMGYL